MLQKISEKNIALELRKKGFSYREILEKIKVSKSTLSLWLRSVGLSEKQEQRLSEKKLLSALKGAEKRREDRINLTAEIKNKASNEIGKITTRELWLIGTALYWAEGSKEKDYNPGSGVRFSNSDPEMIKLFLSWVYIIIKTRKEDIGFDIYIHESHRNNIDRVVNYWVSQTGFSHSNFKHIYFKRNKLKTKRNNIGENYYGLLRVTIKSSSSLNRKIAGWVRGICKSI